MAHEFNGKDYRKASTHQKEWGNRIISELLLKGDERILDLGCGDGTLTAQLAKLVPDGFILGIDSSQGMIAAANCIQGGNLSFKLMDINLLDFKDEFDLVFSNATLHWIKDHNCLLKNINTCLRENGIIRYNFAAEGNCLHFFKVIRETIALTEYSNYFRKFEWPWYMPSVEEYDKLVRQVSFREIKVWGEIADRFFPDVNSMTQWVDQPSIVPFLEHIPPLIKQSFRDYVVEKMIRETLQADGTCFETFRRINVFARK